MRNEKYSDGGYGWVIVASAFVIGFITDGLMFSFGILMVELLEQFHQDRAQIAIIISAMMGVSHLIGPFTGALCEKFGHRVVVILGSIVASSGFVLCAFADGVLYMTLSYGVLGGIGFGLMYPPGGICVIQHFTERRSLATGTAACGSGVGNFCLSHLSRYLIKCYGWRGTLLLEGAIILHGLACGLLLLHPTRTASTKLKRRRNSEELFTLETNVATESNILEDDETSEEPEKDKYKEVLDNRKIKDGITTFCKAVFCVDILKDKRWWLFFLSTVMFVLAFTVPINLLPDLGKNEGMTKEDTAWLISSIGISNAIGRICTGWIGDKGFVNRVVFLDAIIFLAGLATGLSFLLRTFELKLIYTSLMGLCAGGYITLCPVVLADIFGVEVISKSYGLLMFSIGFASLIATPFGGWLFDKTGTYDLTFIAVGVEFVLSGIFLLGLKLIKQK